MTPSVALSEDHSVGHAHGNTDAYRVVHVSHSYETDGSDESILTQADGRGEDSPDHSISTASRVISLVSGCSGGSTLAGIMSAEDIIRLAIVHIPRRD